MILIKYILNYYHHHVYHRRQHPVNLQCSFLSTLYFLPASSVSFHSCVHTCGLCLFLCYNLYLWVTTSASDVFWVGSWLPSGRPLGQIVGHPEVLGTQQVSRLTTPTHLQPTKLHIMSCRQLAIRLCQPPPNSGKTVWSIYIFLSLSSWNVTDFVSAYSLCPSNTSMLLTKHLILNNDMFYGYYLLQKALSGKLERAAVATFSLQMAVFQRKLRMHAALCVFWGYVYKMFLKC